MSGKGGTLEDETKVGRPPRGEEPCTYPVSGRVTKTNHEWLKEQAEERSEQEGRRVTKSQLLNEAVTVARQSDV